MPFVIDTTGLAEDQIAVLNSDAVKAALEASYTKSHDEDEKPLRAIRDTTLQEKRILEAKMKEYDDLGGLEALKKAKDLEGNVKKKDTDLTTKDQQVQQLTDMVQKMKDQALNSQLSAKLAADIRAAGGVPELLEGVIKPRLKPELDENGQLKVTVMTEDGSTGWVVDGRDATIKDLLGTYKSNTTFARAFDATPHNGGGGKPSVGGAEENPFAAATRNVTKQTVLINTDRARAITLANAAGVKLPGLNVAKDDASFALPQAA